MEMKESKKDTKEKEALKEKETVKEEENKIEKKNNKLTDKQKEIIITAIVLIVSIVVGFFIGKVLFDAMYK